MDGINVIIWSDGIHICIETVARLKSKISKSHSLPLRKRLDNLHPLFTHILYREGDRPFHTVKVIVDSTAGSDKERRCDTAELQGSCDFPLK